MQGSVAIIEPDLTPAVGSEPVQVIAGGHATNRARRNGWYVAFGDRRPCGLRTRGTAQRTTAVRGTYGGFRAKQGFYLPCRRSTRTRQHEEGHQHAYWTAYKVSIEAVMMITEFLAGWSSDGITAGVVTSVASRK